MASKIPILFAILSQKKLSQKQLSTNIGVSEGNISDWKSGRAAPGIEVLPKIADYLNCSIDYLLGRNAEPAAVSDEITADEQEVLTLMKSLNDDGMKQLLKQARYIASDDEYKKGNQPVMAKEA